MGFYDEFMRMQHFGDEDMAQKVSKEIFCQTCDTELTDEEIDHCKDFCFNCYDMIAYDYYFTLKHPDEIGGTADA